MNPSLAGDLLKEGHLIAVIVLDIHVMNRLNTFLGDVTVEYVERIVEAERRLGAKVELVFGISHEVCIS